MVSGGMVEKKDVTRLLKNMILDTNGKDTSKEAEAYRKALRDCIVEIKYKL